MSAISFAELDALTGELLPERSVLSTLNPMGVMGGHGGGSSSSSSSSASAVSGGGGGHHGALVSSACQAVSGHHSSTLTCVPATTVVF
ncbi:hypothetical protein ABZ484_09030 [Streptomyces sp. NPDC006393]|uniref:hypothetical protein n=1 Tax=Streptomyces sp. NPDC006393 TaxID=3156763 RepID=UPI0033F13147